ncbi:MAG: hypothetical protein CM15mP78_16850 [Candidatus Poseidoniales archaeon]|nr:MAG: hypothetical protein CM15mP78_16850 [Candidatus Poseidoniales archaeon]
MITIPEEGDIPVDLCVSDQFPYSTRDTVVQWRQVSRAARRATLAHENGPTHPGKARALRW